MDSCFATFAAFLVALWAAAGGAPAGSAGPEPCADVRTSSVEFNQVAKTVSVEAQRGSRDVGRFNTSLIWIEAQDMCDPESLKDRSKPCVGKMLSVLTLYRSAVESVSTFQSCSEFARRVKPALQQLHQDMSSCVNSVGGGSQDQSGPSEVEAKPIPTWLEPQLCRYIMDRLFSFSILTARIFAVGDPALHSSSAPKCL